MGANEAARARLKNQIAQKVAVHRGNLFLFGGSGAQHFCW